MELHPKEPELPAENTGKMPAARQADTLLKNQLSVCVSPLQELLTICGRFAAIPPGAKIHCAQSRISTFVPLPLVSKALHAIHFAPGAIPTSYSFESIGEKAFVPTMVPIVCVP